MVRLKHRLPAPAQRAPCPGTPILVLPILFAAGMSLLDSLDGLFMNFAYGWAFARPVRKVYYNITITGLSVAVALIIGLVEILSIFVDKLGIESGAAPRAREPRPQRRRLPHCRTVRADLDHRICSGGRPPASRNGGTPAWPSPDTGSPS